MDCLQKRNNPLLLIRAPKMLIPLIPIPSTVHILGLPVIAIVNTILHVITSILVAVVEEGAEFGDGGFNELLERGVPRRRRGVVGASTGER